MERKKLVGGSVGEGGLAAIELKQGCDGGLLVVGMMSNSKKAMVD